MGTKAQRKNLLHWKYLVECKDVKAWPNNDRPNYVFGLKARVVKVYKSGEKKDMVKTEQYTPNRYEYFNDGVKQFVTNVLTRDNTAIEGMQKESDAFNDLEYDYEGISRTYWDVLMRSPKNKELIGNVLPPIEQTDDESKQKVYDAFMPAYRAIRERFEKRWFFEWIFNHKEYTTERDTMKALQGLMTGLTRDGDNVFAEKYRAYKNDVVLSEDDLEQLDTRIRTAKERFKQEREKDAENPTLPGLAHEIDRNLNMSLRDDSEDEIEKDEKVHFPIEDLKNDPKEQKIDIEQYRNVNESDLSQSMNSSL